MPTGNYREKCLEAKGEECVACDSTENIVAHHKDGDRSNDDLDNLVPLCASCHARLHATENPPERLRELWEQIPDHARANRPDTGVKGNRKDIRVHEETKRDFKEFIPGGVTQNYAVRWLLHYARDSRGRMYDLDENSERCPNCLDIGVGDESFEASLTCTNKDCRVRNFRAE